MKKKSVFLLLILRLVLGLAGLRADLAFLPQGDSRCKQVDPYKKMFKCRAAALFFGSGFIYFFYGYRKDLRDAQLLANYLCAFGVNDARDVFAL